MQRPVALLVLGVLLSVGTAEAQRSGGRAPATRAPARPSAEARALAIRAELAEVLLQSKRYEEAAREYRGLVEADGTNTRYRLGLAQSLAWGGRYRDAERELRVLATARPTDLAVDTLLRSVRASMRPSVREATAWVAERPRHAPYRFALARALARDGQHRIALAHFDTLMATAPTPGLLREMAAVHRAANDLPGGLELLRNAVARVPADTAARRAYAALLVEARQFDAALAQNDTVLLAGRDAAVLVERAWIDIAREDLDAAAADLNASIAVRPTADAYLLLGDVHRWRGDFGGARGAYQLARGLNPRSREVAARFAQLARDERPAVLFGTSIKAYPGWRTRAAHTSDNGGTHYSTVAAHRGFDLPFAITGSAGVELRQLGERLLSGDVSTTGYAAEVALVRGASYGALYGELRTMGGSVYHHGAGTRPYGAASLAASWYGWTASAEVAAGPAYPSLMTTAFLTDADRGGPWLTERTVAGSIAGPVGAVDAGIAIRQSDLNDANRRTVVQGHARYPISRLLSAVYSGSAVSFANRSQLYWDPSRHVTNTVGLQLAERRMRGLSYRVTLLPGVAYSEDSPYLRAPIGEADDRRLRAHIGAEGELTWRGRRWETVAGYSWGRLGAYERNDARIGLRFVP